MTLAGVSAAASSSADPFGLWQSPVPAGGGVISFGVPGEGAPAGPDADPSPAAVWTLALTSGPLGGSDAAQELRQLEERVRAIEAGLESAGPRADALLSARARQLEASGVSFSVEAVEELPPPEAGLALALEVIEPPAASAASFGAPGALPAGLDWEALYQRLSVLFDSVNRQILHFAWVDTTLDGRLVARSTVNWGGDLATTWLVALPADQRAAHSHSLKLAMESRLASLRAILTVSQIAGKIALALATPLGPLQALALAWQFVNTVIIQ